jgi:hypothetical protein
VGDEVGKGAGGRGVVGGLAVLNGRLEKSGWDLSNRLGSETRYYRWRGGDLAYAVAGRGESLLLVHGVYALDLLGCGLSERPRRRYGSEDMTSQVEDFARE